MENDSAQAKETLEETQQPEELLYHYTDQAGLDGILSSGCMWATHYKFLNDAAERAIGFDTYLKTIKKYVNRGGVSERDVNYLMEKFISHLNNVDTYSISFSRDIKDKSGKTIKNGDDRLSQWRGYAPGAQGYCLGFQHQAIRTIADTLQTKMHIQGHLNTCYYDRESFGSFVEKDIDGIFSVIRACMGDALIYMSTNSEFVKSLDWMAEIIVGNCTIYKHIGFSEEAETRFSIQFIHGSSDVSLINFRPGKLGNTPYIEIPIGIRDQPSSLSQITVGPTANQEQTMAILRIRLQQLGLSQVKVIPSQIPYRNW